jgi:hypothetical protein
MPGRASDGLVSAAFSADGRGVLGAGFLLWLFGLGRPSPLRTVGADFARRNLSG